MDLVVLVARCVLGFHLGRFVGVVVASLDLVGVNSFEGGAMISPGLRWFYIYVVARPRTTFPSLLDK